MFQNLILMAQKHLKMTARTNGPANRVTDEGSWVELASRKAAIRSEMRMRLYLYGDHFLLCSVAGNSEVGDPTRVKNDVSDHDLGLLVCDHLLQFQTASPDFTDKKLTDWPAYRSSGAPSVKAFESKAWMVSVSSNPSVRIEACPRKTLKPELSALCISSERHSDIGTAVRLALRAAQTLREHAVI